MFFPLQLMSIPKSFFVTNKKTQTLCLGLNSMCFYPYLNL